VQRDPISSAVFIYGLGGAVAFCWVASVFASIIWHGHYDTPVALHGLMGTVVGSVFADAKLRAARKRIARRHDDDGSDS
jgi:hypothetical protein